VDTEPAVFYRHNFTPLDATNETGSNILNFGPHILDNFDTQLQSLAEPRYLTTYYNNILTRYNGGECTDSFEVPNNQFNLRVLGFILLDGSNNLSTYSDAEFIPLSEFDPICGEFHNEVSDPNWRGVEFDLTPPGGGSDFSIDDTESDDDIER